MWAIVIFSLLFFVFAVFAVSALLEGELFKTVLFSVLAIIQFILALLSAVEVGNEAPRIKEKESNYYEVVVTAPVTGKGTLVYAVDLDGNKGKADILAEYPMKGYKIEQVGKRTFLLPESTRVAQGKEGEIALISEEEVFNVPPVVTSGK